MQYRACTPRHHSTAAAVVVVTMTRCKVRTLLLLLLSSPPLLHWCIILSPPQYIIILYSCYYRADPLRRPTVSHSFYDNYYDVYSSAPYTAVRTIQPAADHTISAASVFRFPPRPTPTCFSYLLDANCTADPNRLETV